MHITKIEIKYKERLTKELLARVIPWTLISIIFWIFLAKSNNALILLILSGQVLGLLIMIQSSFQWARYQIVNVLFTKDSFRISYLDKDEMKEISSTNNEIFKVELKNHGWGIFPLNPKKRVNSLVLENQDKKIKLFQNRSKTWKSSELYDLYYDGFHFYYYKYWIKKFEIQFKTK